MKRKTGKKLLGILLTLAMVIGLMPGMRLTAYAKSEVKYLDASGTEQSITNYTVVESDTKWRQGWYVVNSDVEINQTNGISFSGDANLILCDGAKLTVTSSRDGISASRGSLTIYAQSTSDNMGKLEVTSGSAGIRLLKNLTINGGKIETQGSNGISSQGADITINGGNVTADGGIFFSTPNNLTITGGKVIASATGTDSGIYTEGEVIISGGNVSVTGDENPAIDGTVKNSIAGTGWTNKAGTEGKADIAISTGQTLDYIKVQFPAAASHTHNFTYSSDGAVITATCSASGCTLTDNKATLTIVKPTLTAYGQAGEGISANATLTGITDFNTATGKTIAATDIKYVGRDGTNYAESATAPANAGKYTAKITVEEKTASVDYEIDKAQPTTPTGLTATYGQTLADVTLPAGWTWADSTQSVGDIVSPAASFKANFAGDDNYNAASNVDVTVNVGIADNPMTYAETQTVTKAFSISSQTATLEAAENGVGELSYGITSQKKGEDTVNYFTLDGTTLTIAANTSVGTYTLVVYARAAGNGNYFSVIKESTVTVTVEKVAPTVTAPTTKTLTYTGSAQELVNAGSTNDGTLYYAVTTENTAPTDASLYTTSIPSKTDAGTYYVWYKVVGDENHKDTEPKSVTAVIRGTISAAVTFKVVNGSWNDETTADRTVTLTGLEGDTLKLTADQIPAVGSKPADTFKAGAWDVVPSTETAITAATTYTYTYAQKDSISQTVTFKVVNGSWDDETTADKTVTLTGHEGDALKLAADQIPAVGTKPADTYKAGAWDVVPSTETAITAATTYTYTYAAKDSISQTVTFKVVNGSWDDGNTADITVTLTGLEGDTLKLAKNQIPAVGTKPADTFKAGAWDVTPSTETAITAATTYTYTYAAKDSISQTVTFKVVNGSWDDDNTADITVTLTGLEGDTLKLAENQIPAVGTKPADTYKAGAWDVVPNTETAITAATTYTYTYEAKSAAVVTAVPTAKALTYDGTAQELITAGAATGGTMKYAVTTENAPPKDDSLYTETIPTRTDAGTYYVWYKAVGDSTHTDSKPACVTVTIGEKIVYTAAVKTSATVDEHTIGSGEDAVLVFHRSVDDAKTIEHFTSAAVDGKTLSAGDYSIKSGSLILTLKASYLDTLTPGTHQVTATFDDGSADTTIMILEAPATATPTNVPKTGDGADLGLWLTLMLAGLLLLGGWAVYTIRKRS